MLRRTLGATLLTVLATLVGTATAEQMQGAINLEHAGPLAFAPDGVLLIGDTKAATLYAVQTGDTDNRDAGAINLEQVDSKIAGMLGTSADNILVNDLTVNPDSGHAYMSVSRGMGPDAVALMLKITPAGEISEFALDDVTYHKAALPNAKIMGRRDRLVSITNIGYHEGKVIVAGLSNEEFASTLRTLDYPFSGAGKSTAVEIYHGNHGAWETRSPVETFATVDIDGKPYVVAAYTCTPLVLFPMDALKEGAKVNGVTVAELGARNRPWDMFVYGDESDRKILMSNSTYGIMKISLQGITDVEPITERVGGTAGQPFETVEELEGVVQLAQAGNGALALIDEQGAMNLRTVALP